MFQTVSVQVEQPQKVVIGMAEAGLVVVGMAVGNEVGFHEGENVDGVTDVGWVVGVKVGINVDDLEVGALVGFNVDGCDVGFEVGINVVGFNDVGWEVGMELGISDGYPKRGVGYHNEKKMGDTFRFNQFMYALPSPWVWQREKH